MGGATCFLCVVLSIHAASTNPIASRSSSNTTSPTPNTTSSTLKTPSPTPNTTSSTLKTSSPTPNAESSTQKTTSVSNTTPINHKEPLSPPPYSTYEVTEIVIDIPDDRTLASIAPNYGITVPLNLANNNKKNKTTDPEDESELKRTSFTYIHISKEPPEKPNENVIVKLFRGIQNYIIGFKKSWIDGLHSFAHKDDCDKKEEANVNGYLHGHGKKIEEDGYHDHRSHNGGIYYDYEHDEFRHKIEHY